ncbi:DUF4843 domain-containing protein [Paraflavitalea sp. CAU 1676]|uniref:DUF4843 domain-containing protein n=1 Tax=Paraflavitalea sp. CAU 1676 TaxID=3032598 RepID=UPI0023D98736|nr:DUF4843 domain-containing protein [Paraflavitalea sp. CAU 1676]MDF2188890.1 DUF4843 domain-containing protein [Paraflavitalea sp. CAU 1676]
MKQVIIIILSIMAGVACKKTPDILYRAPLQNVYFDIDPQDSTVYTFAYHPELAKDTVYLRVRLAGLRADSLRQYGVMVVDSNTTAKAGLHYEPFKAWYTLKEDAGVALLPVILLNTDVLLQTKSVMLTLKLKPGAGLDTSVNKLIKTKVVFSAKLEQPKWWTKWPLGAYSRNKHQLFMIATGVTSMTEEGLDAPRNLYLVGRLNVMLADPFAWVNNNPEKGYVITQRADGNYDFYATSNPANKILVRKDTATGRFYFVDENGLDII